MPINRKLSVNKKKIKKVVATGRKDSVGFVRLHCTVCNKDYDVKTSNPAMYTEEIRKGMVCLHCKK